MAQATAAKSLRYRGADGIVRWVEVDPACWAEMERYDRWLRRRAQRFRQTHATNSDRVIKAAIDPIPVVGYLNAELEPATRSLCVHSDEKPGEWEGPRVPIDRYRGDNGVWSGEDFAAPEKPHLYREYDPSTKSEQWVHVQSCTVCPVCRGGDLGGVLDGEVIVSVLCIGCGRSNVDHEIGRPTGLDLARRRDEKPSGPTKYVPSAELKGGRG